MYIDVEKFFLDFFGEMGLTSVCVYGIIFAHKRREGVHMTVTLEKQPKKYLQSVDDATRRKLLKGIENIQSMTGDIKKLKGTANQYRYKIAHYRILYEWRQSENQIIITAINTRTNIKY